MLKMLDIPISKRIQDMIIFTPYFPLQELKLDRDLDTTRTSLPHKSMFHGILGGCVAVF